GKVALSRPGSIHEKLKLSHSGWVAARSEGPWHRLILNDAQAYAHTSPVYIKFGGERLAEPEDVRFWTDWIEQLISRVHTRGRFSSDERRKEVEVLFGRALESFKGLSSTSP